MFTLGDEKMNDKLFLEIDKLNEQYLKIWEDVCNIESPTDYKEGVDAVGNYFVKLAEEHGWQVESFPQNTSGNAVCITLNPDSPEKPVTFSGHIDTVHPIGAFGIPAVKQDAEKIYGPGVRDCKGGVVAAFMAMDALGRIGFQKRPIQLLIQTDEEVGSLFSDKATIQYICNKAKDSIAFLNMEGHDAGKACIERKGIINYKITVTGQSAHASKCCVEGSNAIVEAAYKILQLEKFKDVNGITCSCDMVQGGTAINTVPEKCVFYADVRFSTFEQMEQIKEHVKNIAESCTVPGCTATAEIESYRPAMTYAKRNEDLLARMNIIFKQNGLSVLEPQKRTGGSDAAEVTEYGIPCVDSLGVEGGNIHTLNEYGIKASLSRCAKRAAVVALNIDMDSF